MFESMMSLQGTPLSGQDTDSNTGSVIGSLGGSIIGGPVGGSIGGSLGGLLGGKKDDGPAVAISGAEVTGGDWTVDMGGKQISIVLIAAVVAAIYLFTR